MHITRIYGVRLCRPEAEINYNNTMPVSFIRAVGKKRFKYSTPFETHRVAEQESESGEVKSCSSREFFSPVRHCMLMSNTGFFRIPLLYAHLRYLFCFSSFTFFFSSIPLRACRYTCSYYIEIWTHRYKAYVLRFDSAKKIRIQKGSARERGKGCGRGSLVLGILRVTE